jgi:chorismate dehydratase
MQSNPGDRTPLRPTPLRVGSVSFLNAKPLIHGLEHDSTIDLGLDVPSRLLDGLRDGRRFDVALLPVIDYQRMPGLRLLTAGGICCDGPTLTVRIFSPVPIERIESLACDTDSHTSVALARILLAERYNVRPEFMDLHAAAADEGHTTAARANAARLLIGDKVVCEEPRDLPYQLDLGEAWRHWTGLPFVFAAWMARPGIDLGDLPARLEQAKRTGLAHLDEIITRHARPRGWPVDVARRYLTEHLQFDITDRHLEAIRRFHRLASEHGIIGPPRELELYASRSTAAG